MSLFRVGVAFAFLLSSSASARLAYVIKKNEERQVVLASDYGSDAQVVSEPRRWAMHPALDTRGRWLAYVEGEDHRDLQLVLQPLPERGAPNLRKRERWTLAPGKHRHPRFSADGSVLAFSGPYGPDGAERVAYVRLREALLAKPESVVAPGDGPHWVRTPEIHVVPDERPSSYPAVSSDGSFLLYVRRLANGRRVVTRYDVATGQRESLTPEDVSADSPALSFDDRYVAYTAHVGGNWDVYRLDLRFRTLPPTRLTDDRGRDFAPRFRSNGAVVFVSDREGHGQLYEIFAGSLQQGRTDAFELVVGGADFDAPSLSADARIVFPPTEATNRGTAPSHAHPGPRHFVR